MTKILQKDHQMNTLVTGGAGFIGSHLVKTLLDAGHSVVCVDNESSEGHESFKWDCRAKNLRIDINDLVVTDFEGIDVVFHMAAEVSIPRCIADPNKTFKSNCTGTFHLLNCACKASVSKFIFSSTSAIYGNGTKENLPQTEKDMEDCLNIYATTKLMGEKLCQLYSKEIDTICLRYFNVYGEGQSNKGQYCPVVAVFQKQLEQGVPLTVVGDGEQTRDYIHVSDIVSANILACAIKERGNGRIVNIGTGTAHSVNNIAHMIAEEDGKVVFVPARKGEARHTLCDNTLARDFLFWQPVVQLTEWLNKQTTNSIERV